MSSSEGRDVERLLDELVRLSAIALRQGFDGKADYIVTLSRAGFENARIAEFLGDSTDSVRSPVNRARSDDR